VDQNSVVFWVLPWKFLLLMLGGLFLILFLIRSFFRKFEFKKR